MSALLVWLNAEEARLFYLEKESISVKKLPFDNQQLADELTEMKLKQVLLMGPAKEPTQFSLYLEKSYPDIYEKIIGVEKVDRMPDSEILSIGSKFLQKHFLYSVG